MVASVGGASTVATPGGLPLNTTQSRTVTGLTTNNPFSFTTQTDTTAINGKTFTSTYNAAGRTSTRQTPLGKQSVVTLDIKGRPITLHVPNSTLADVAISYDPQGRLHTVTQDPGAMDARTTTWEYDLKGRLASLTDPLTQTTQLGYDTADRVTTETLPDLRVIRLTYDPNGNVQSVTPPGRPAHNFDYTPIDQEQLYTPPALLNGGPTQYTYNFDHQLTQVIRPDNETITLGSPKQGSSSARRIEPVYGGRLPPDP